MSLRRKEPETRKEIDAEILRIKRQISSLPEDAYGQVALLVDDLELLEAKKISLLRPWEVSRPKSERSLSAWGAV